MIGSRFVLPVMLSLVLMLSACGGRSSAVPEDPPVPRRGHLVIIGGGLDTDNAAVYERILELGGGADRARVAILPTASGEPEVSGPSYVEDFTRYGASGRAEVVPIVSGEPAAAHSPANVERIRQSTVVFFTGGVQERILEVFRPNSIATPADAAVREVLRRGGVVAGTSAGAAMMSHPMIRWGNSHDAVLLGVSCEREDRFVCVAPGMGFFPYGLTDQHFLRRGRLGRLIVAQRAQDIPRGYGVADNRALVADLRTGELTMLGTRAVLMSDITGLQSESHALRNIRLSLVGERDRIDGNTGVVTAWAPRLILPSRNAPTIVGGDAWGREAISDMIAALAFGEATEGTLTTEPLTLRLIVDEHTRFHSHSLQPNDALTAIDVRLDIEFSEDAFEFADRLRASLNED